MSEINPTEERRRLKLEEDERDFRRWNRTFYVLATLALLFLLTTLAFGWIAAIGGGDRWGDLIVTSMFTFIVFALGTLVSASITNDCEKELKTKPASRYYDPDYVDSSRRSRR